MALKATTPMVIKKPTTILCFPMATFLAVDSDCGIFEKNAPTIITERYLRFLPRL